VGQELASITAFLPETRKRAEAWGRPQETDLSIHVWEKLIQTRALRFCERGRLTHGTRPGPEKKTCGQTHGLAYGFRPAEGGRQPILFFRPDAPNTPKDRGNQRPISSVCLSALSANKGAKNYASISVFDSRSGRCDWTIGMTVKKSLGPSTTKGRFGQRNKGDRTPDKGFLP